jgi:hypothetical protein
MEIGQRFKFLRMPASLGRLLPGKEEARGKHTTLTWPKGANCSAAVRGFKHSALRQAESLSQTQKENHHVDVQVNVLFSPRSVAAILLSLTATTSNAQWVQRYRGSKLLGLLSVCKPQNLISGAHKEEKCDDTQR